MNIFSYESKITQITMVIADMIIVNLLYLICCIPIVTIGAAQAGLFTAIRVLLDPEDDSSVAKAYFRGFGSGFFKITAVTAILELLLAAMVYILPYALAYTHNTGSKVSLIICIVVMCAIYIVQCVSGPFHATFGCTIPQLLRNSLFLFIGYPIRCLVSAVLIAVPLAVMLLLPNLFAGAIIAILALYYSVAFLGVHALLKKPLNRLKKSFYAAQNGSAENAESTPAMEQSMEQSEE